MYTEAQAESRRAAVRKWRLLNPGAEVTRKKAYRASPEGAAKEAASKRAWRIAHPDKVKAHKAASYSRHKERINIATKVWYRTADPFRLMFLNKRQNAKRLGIPFSLVFEDICFPEFCPALGLRLDYSRGTKGYGGRRNSPSFDRLDPTCAYSPENTLIVSHLANLIRSDFTPEELAASPRAVAEETGAVVKFYATLFASLEKQPPCT